MSFRAHWVLSRKEAERFASLEAAIVSSVDTMSTTETLLPLDIVKDRLWLGTVVVLDLEEICRPSCSSEVGDRTTGIVDKAAGVSDTSSFAGVEGSWDASTSVS